MSKIKLTVSEFEKFEIACEATDVRIEEKKTYGKNTVVVVNIKHPSQLYQAGLIQSQIEVSAIKVTELPVTPSIDETTVVKSKKDVGKQSE